LQSKADHRRSMGADDVLTNVTVTGVSEAREHGTPTDDCGAGWLGDVPDCRAPGCGGPGAAVVGPAVTVFVVVRVDAGSVVE
jgi:hypothetical protein